MQNVPVALYSFFHFLFSFTSYFFLFDFFFCLNFFIFVSTGWTVLYGKIFSAAVKVKKIQVNYVFF